MVYSLKIEPPYFEAVISGEKKFEIRINDRDFRKGDNVVLMEFDLSTGFTGRSKAIKITYVTSFMQKDNWVVFAFVFLPN
jgi:ASC-1-like (ASCH) protein